MLEQITTDSLTWHYSPAETVERSGAVHVWCCDLDDPKLDSFCDDSALSDCEWQRAERLNGDNQRRVFVRRRALRRFLLGKFLDIPPASLCLIVADSGKPRLAEIQATRCEFNTSHSENVFVMAISETGAVGVDVEVVRPEWDWESVAAMYLYRIRLTQLKSFPERDQQKQFLRFWSLHEAFAKAGGCGLTHNSGNTLSPGSVLDLIFESENFPPALPLTNWTWSQRASRVGGNTAIVSIALHHSLHLSHSHRGERRASHLAGVQNLRGKICYLYREIK
jgi:4'-phosphopantetheinyl transferase